MYNPNNKFWGKNRNKFTQDSIDNWLKTVDPHKYQVATADIQGWYSNVYSILNMKDRCVWFVKETPLSIVTKKNDSSVEIRFLIGGHKITNKRLAQSLISPISSWHLGVRAIKDGYNLKIRRGLSKTGAHVGQKISIIEGQTLVFTPRRNIDGNLVEEQIYIKELQGTKDGPTTKELCPERNYVDQYHDYTCWYSFDKLAYQSCRYCNNLWIQEKDQKYHKLEHPPWNIIRKIKNGSMLKKFLLHLPNAEIFWDDRYDNFYYESFNPNSTKMKNSNNDNLIPSYPTEPKINDTL